MKPLSVIEVQNLALELKTFEGSRLQEVRLCRDLFCLGLYGESLYWLVFDLNANSPQVVVLPNLDVLKLREEKKPIVLFTKANLLRASLTRVEADLAMGRVLVLGFSNNGICELRLFPHGPNVIVQSQGKSIALHKPTPIHQLEVPPIMPTQLLPILSEKSAQWLAWWQAKQQTKNQKPEIKKNTSKIERAIHSIESDLKEKRKEFWQETGEWLKAHQSLKVPDEFADFIDVKKNFSQNLARCFDKAKELQKKMAGAEARLCKLREQFSQVDGLAQVAGKWPKTSQHSGSQQTTFLQGAAARGRTFELSGGVIFYIGKSAEDNLRILREAKSWYFWLHLRDEPGAHGILTRNKNQKIPQTVLHEAAQCLLSKTYGERQKDYYGQKFAILVAECRFVRPIKGDRLGRVQYSNENSFLHLFKNS